jgi:2-polyprenyl-3-methyl-5-hydroxy-6-metoxy-1,4-benzoquinol methylase
VGNTCPLCANNAVLFCGKPNHIFYECVNCNGIFRPKATYLSNELEKEHYEKHNNDINDIRYQNFVSPIVNAILKDFTSIDIGLDFGSGTGPVIAKMLTDKKFSVANYDLYFANDLSLLQNKYHFVSCCEVMEHFKNPLQEFQLLRNLLLPKGKLYCKTNIYSNQKPFEDWYYKDDPTHVFIYQKKTLEWISTNLKFSNVIIYDDVIVFES